MPIEDFGPISEGTQFSLKPFFMLEFDTEDHSHVTVTTEGIFNSEDEELELTLREALLALAEGI